MALALSSLLLGLLCEAPDLGAREGVEDMQWLWQQGLGRGEGGGVREEATLTKKKKKQEKRFETAPVIEFVMLCLKSNMRSALWDKTLIIH